MSEHTEYTDTTHDGDAPTDEREQELLWPARQHPDELILPDAHPTRFPGTWVAIFEGSLPKDQVNALRLNGYSLYKHVVALPGQRLQVIIREEDRPGRDGDAVHEPTQARYEQYEHTYRGGRPND